MPAGPKLQTLHQMPTIGCGFRIVMDFRITLQIREIPVTVTTSKVLLRKVYTGSHSDVYRQQDYFGDLKESIDVRW